MHKKGTLNSSSTMVSFENKPKHVRLISRIALHQTISASGGLFKNTTTVSLALHMKRLKEVFDRVGTSQFSYYFRVYGYNIVFTVVHHTSVLQLLGAGLPCLRDRKVACVIGELCANLAWRFSAFYSLALKWPSPN